jgi:hypothetical protein
VDVKQLLWEGPTPVTPPNTGRSVSFAWCPEDWRKFELSVRTAYPNVFFYEGLKNSEESGEAEPPLIRIERLDQSRRDRKIEMCFPAPEWLPRLIRMPNKWGKLQWTFDQYWSPRIWMDAPRTEPIYDLWWHVHGEIPAHYWPGNMIQSSFRQQFEREKRIEAKIMNLARKIGRRMVHVYWGSLADFHAGIGRVYGGFGNSKSFAASEGVIDWYRQNRGATICVEFPKRSGSAFSRMPPEDVPDHFWGDVKKPKWVLEAIEKYRR